jgi:hypothetical protein
LVIKGDDSESLWGFVISGPREVHYNNASDKLAKYLTYSGLTTGQLIESGQ